MTLPSENMKEYEKQISERSLKQFHQEVATLCLIAIQTYSIPSFGLQPSYKETALV